MYKKLASFIKSGLFLMALLATPVMGQVPINPHPDFQKIVVTKDITCHYIAEEPGFTLALGSGKQLSFNVSYDEEKGVLQVERRELQIMETYPVQYRERALTVRVKFHQNGLSETTAKVVQTSWFDDGLPNKTMGQVREVRLHPMAELFLLSVIKRTRQAISTLEATRQMMPGLKMDPVLVADIKALVAARQENFLILEAEGDGLESNE